MSNRAPIQEVRHRNVVVIDTSIAEMSSLSATTLEMGRDPDPLVISLFFCIPGFICGLYRCAAAGIFYASCDFCRSLKRSFSELCLLQLDHLMLITVVAELVEVRRSCSACF